MERLNSEKLIEIVKDGYEEVAEDFNNTRRKVLWPELFELVKDIKPGSKVLDAGCGNGRLLEALQIKRIDYLGLDNSPALITLAKKNYSNYDFQVCDILDLDKLPATGFDYIFSIAVLHHLPGPDLQIKALGQLRDKLTKNGRLILSVQNFWTKTKYRKLIFKFAFLKLITYHQINYGDFVFLWNHQTARYYHAFTERELKKISARAGLQIEKIYSDKFNYYLVLTAKSF